MRPDAPKSQELFLEIEEVVKDAILTEECEDPILDQTLLLVINSISTGRHLYANPLEEPAFYQKYLRRWVDEGLGELAKLKKFTEKSGENG